MDADTNGEYIIICIILAILFVVIAFRFDNYKKNIRQDLIEHKIIMHDPTTGKLIYTSDKSPFNY